MEHELSHARILDKHCRAPTLRDKRFLWKTGPWVFLKQAFVCALLILTKKENSVFCNTGVLAVSCVQLQLKERRFGAYYAEN